MDHSAGSGATTINHVAFPTVDTAATVDFYTRVLGMKLVAAVREEAVPSTGELTPFLHTFFALGSGECIAFFDIEGQAPPTDDGIPSWVRHVAMDVPILEDVEAWRTRLLAEGLDVRGVVDHEGIWQSIYFFDPNGVRLEFTWQARALHDEDAAAALATIESWLQDQMRNTGEEAVAG